MSAAVRVTLYSARGCHLCDAAADVIRAARHRRDFDFTIVRIDGDPELEARFRPEIPVVHVNDRFAFRHRVDTDALLAQIEEAERSWNT